LFKQGDILAGFEGAGNRQSVEKNTSEINVRRNHACIKKNHLSGGCETINYQI